MEGGGFEPSVPLWRMAPGPASTELREAVPRVMDIDLGRQVQPLIAVFELAGTAVTLQRSAKVIRSDSHPEFP